jgi:hypothetical protein
LRGLRVLREQFHLVASFTISLSHYIEHLHSSFQMTTVTTHPAELRNGVWTSWLPVTTAWTLQARCSTAAWVRGGLAPDDNAWPYIYDPDYGLSVADTVTCLPPEATQWWNNETTVTGTITRWSIGPIVCPAAYTTEGTVIVSGSSTSVVCCPRCVLYVYHSPNHGAELPEIQLTCCTY